MNKPLHERLAALHDFLSPPCVNSLSPPALELLAEAMKALTPAEADQRAPTLVEFPWPSLHAGMRLVTGAYPRAAVSAYGDARAAERDTFWQIEIDRIKRIHGAELVEFIGIDPVSITAGAHLPMIPDSWRFGFHQPESGLLRFQRMDAGQLVAWDAVAPVIDRLTAERDALAEQRPALPPLDDTLRNILGRICFTLIPLVNMLRAGGHEIKNKAEDEQAAAIHRMLGHYFAHGAEWQAAATADINRMRQQSEAESVKTFTITGVEVKAS